MLNNAVGTIYTDSSSSVVINNSTINGGNLTSASGSAIQSTGESVLNGVTLTTGSTYSIISGYTALTAQLVNNGTVNIGALGSPATLYADVNGGTISLLGLGGGTINLNDPNSPSGAVTATKP